MTTASNPDGTTAGNDPAAPRLLIVEDNRANRKALGSLIRSAGWHVDEAATGMQAATYLHSGVVPPDVVLLDLMIPDPPGEEIVRLIRDMRLTSRKTGQPTRVVAYTGCDTKNEAVSMAIEAGVDAVILKPSCLDDTLAVLRGDKPGDIELSTVSV